MISRIRHSELHVRYSVAGRVYENLTWAFKRWNVTPNAPIFKHSVHTYDGEKTSCEFEMLVAGWKAPQAL